MEWKLYTKDCHPTENGKYLVGILPDETDIEQGFNFVSVTINTWLNVGFQNLHNKDFFRSLAIAQAEKGTPLGAEFALLRAIFTEIIEEEGFYFYEGGCYHRCNNDKYGTVVWCEIPTELPQSIKEKGIRIYDKA